MKMLPMQIYQTYWVLYIIKSSQNVLLQFKKNVHRQNNTTEGYSRLFVPPLIW